MKLNEELLRNDLKNYVETALRIGLPCAVDDPAVIDRATDAELVDIAAVSGWELGKYVK